MKVIGELFNIDPEQATPENPDYRLLEKGLTWGVVGALAVYGANESNIANLHDHARILIGTVGSLEMWSGGIMACIARDRIKKKSSN